MQVAGSPAPISPAAIRKKTIVCSFAVMLTGGYGYTLYSALLPFVIVESGIDYTQAGLVLTVLSVGLCLASLCSGPLCRLLGVKSTITVGLALLIGGALAATAAANIILLYVAALAFGAGHGINNNLTNSLVNDITSRSTSALNLLHAFYSLGCLLTPLAVWASLAGGLGWRGSAWACLVLCAVSFFFCRVLPAPTSHTEASLPANTNWLRQRRYYLLILLLFCGIGVQNGVMGWSTTYFVEMRLLSEEHAQQLLIVMWAMMLAGRLVFAKLSGKIATQNLLALLCGSCFLLMLVSLPLRHSPILAYIFVLLGFALSGLYPLVVSSAGEFTLHNPTASGLLYALAGTGGMASTFLCGFVAQTQGIQYSYFVVFFISCAAMLASLVNIAWTRRATSK